jgi:hypothetical protein
MTAPSRPGAIVGISELEKDIMGRLLRMKPEQQKAKAKPDSVKGDAQRLRRERERQRPTAASGGD